MNVISVRKENLNIYYNKNEKNILFTFFEFIFVYLVEYAFLTFN